MYRDGGLVPALYKVFYHAKIGYSFMMLFTFSRTAVIVLSHSGAERTVSINSTISAISGSLAPRVVIAGVPTRIPVRLEC